MAWFNEEIAGLLREYAELTQITGGDVFRARNYEKAARSVRGWGDDIGQLDATALRAIPGVGASIAAKIAEYRQSGSIRALDELRAKIPPGVLELTRVPGLGPKRALQLNRDLGVESVDDLAAAIKAGRLDGLAGFGAKSEERIAAGIEVYRQGRERVPLDVALHTATEMVDTLTPLSQRCAYAGSLRRWRETIGDIDILAAADDSAPLMAAFSAGHDVVASGPTKTTVRTASGLTADLRVVPLDAWGAALQYFTGSVAHNVAVRQIAVRAKLKLSEYGLFEAETNALIVSRTEEEVYERLGLAWVPPAMREDHGEIELAAQGRIPRLVRVDDLRGDLHTHTDLTDGVATLEQMLEAAAAKRYAYYAVTDHAPNLAMQRMTDEKMLAQRAKLRGLQDRFPKMTLLHGTELNIDPDGAVDWPAVFLEGFDLTVASIHSHFNQSREAMTRRMIRAMENPHVNVIGHPTTRKIGRRDPVDLDLDAVFEAAARTGTALEIDAYPDRLDLRDEHVRRARRSGVRFAIDTDAHAVGHLDAMRYGIGVAQRGWLTKDDVIDAWPLAKLRRFLQKDV